MVFLVAVIQMCLYPVLAVGPGVAVVVSLWRSHMMLASLCCGGGRGNVEIRPWL